MKKLFFALIMVTLFTTLSMTALANYKQGDTCPKCNKAPLEIKNPGLVDHSVECSDYECGFNTSELHYGGTATCMALAVCEGCGKEYGEKNLDNHNWDTGWTYDSTSHWHKCLNGCGDTSPSDSHKEDHNGGLATCLEKAVCTICWQEYGDYAPHTGGTAYCNAKAVCKVCGKEYGEVDLDNHAPGKFHPATCVEKAYCEVEDRIFNEGRKDPNNHVGPFKNVDEIAPTCVAPGHEAGKICEACGEYAEGGAEIPIDKDAHNWDTDWTTNQKEHWHKCLNEGCDAVKDSERHNLTILLPYDEKLHYRECSVCHCFEKAEGVGAELNTHDDMPSIWKDNKDNTHSGFCGCGLKLVTEAHTGGDASCLNGAICEKCGAEYGKPLDHDWGDWTADNTSTHTRKCKRDGCEASETEAHHQDRLDPNNASEHIYICNVCSKNGFVYKREKHSADKWTDAGDGVNHTGTCICGRQLTEPHTGGEATCTELAECEICHLKYGDVDHDNHPADKIIDVAGKEATCTETGLTDGKKCTACGMFTVEQQVIEKKGHVWKEATCTEPKTCDVCGATEGSAAGHKEVTDPAVEATCTETGLTEGKHCSVCNAVLQKQKVVEKKGHTWKTATCTEPKTCTVCGATEGSVSGHKEVIDPGKPATCGQSGLTEGKHCSICGEVLVAQKVIPATVHWYGPWTPAGEGTHTGDCRRCGDPKTVDCELIEVELASGTIRMCPICGYVEGGEPLTAVEDAKATGAVPESDLVVFALEDGKLFTVAFEIGGKLLQPTGKITLTLPAGTAEVDFGREKAAVVKTKE